jgi:tetratricopeptide (TPR) repeat protein
VARFRAFLVSSILVSCALLAQQQTPPPQPQEPPEEDETLIPKKDYPFNPLQAAKELKTGNFYYSKGNYKAAAGRFREATLWNPGFAEAYFRLGEAEDKLRDKKAAREAYAKFLDLAPQDKRAAEVRKKLSGNP